MNKERKKERIESDGKKVNKLKVKSEQIEREENK